MGNLPQDSEPQWFRNYTRNPVMSLGCRRSGDKRPMGRIYIAIMVRSALD